MKKNMLAASAIALSALISGCSTNAPVPSPSSAVSSPVASESHQDAHKATPSESTDAIASSYDCPAALTPMPSDEDVHGYAVASDGQIKITTNEKSEGVLSGGYKADVVQMADAHSCVSLHDDLSISTTPDPAVYHITDVDDAEVNRATVGTSSVYVVVNSKYLFPVQDSVKTSLSSESADE